CGLGSRWWKTATTSRCSGSVATPRATKSGARTSICGAPSSPRECSPRPPSISPTTWGPFSKSCRRHTRSCASLTDASATAAPSKPARPADVLTGGASACEGVARDLTVLDCNERNGPALELPAEDHVGERTLDEPADGSLHGARTELGV